MPVAALSALVVLVVTLGCSGGAGVGEACARHNDCGDTLQCVKRVCAPRCERATECGDGYACDDLGVCVLAHRQSGESCASEVDCAPGLTCRLRVEGEDRLLRHCTAQTVGAPGGAACATDDDCRSGTCALGRCVDLCRTTRDCALGTSCRQIPHVDAPAKQFGGCLASRGVVSWTIPSPASRWQELRLPVPSGAEHASLVLSTAAPRRVGAVRVTTPARETVYRMCPGDMEIGCSAVEERTQLYQNRLRLRREVGTSVLAIPTTSSVKLSAGIYGANVASFHADGTEGPPPAVTAVVRFGTATTLDLHLHFLDLADHPCGGAFGAARLDQVSAQSEPSFQKDYLGVLRSILKDSAALTLGEVTYADIARPDLDLDALELDRARALFALGKRGPGINVFFVRSLSPAGVQAYAPNPGPPAVDGAPRSGILIGVDTLCYRQWQQLARLTAHELARYMGLFQNVEVDGQRDPIDDSDASSSNLMFYSELGGGMVLSGGQREVLHKSPVLR